jgi:hypothetical protein
MVRPEIVQLSQLTGEEPDQGGDETSSQIPGGPTRAQK